MFVTLEDDRARKEEKMRNRGLPMPGLLLYETDKLLTYLNHPVGFSWNSQLTLPNGCSHHSTRKVENIAILYLGT